MPLNHNAETRRRFTQTLNAPVRMPLFPLIHYIKAKRELL